MAQACLEHERCRSPGRMLLHIADLDARLRNDCAHKYPNLPSHVQPSLVSSISHRY